MDEQMDQTMIDKASLVQNPGLYPYINQAAFAAAPNQEGQQSFEVVQSYAAELVPRLAERSGLPASVIYRLLGGGRLSRDHAQRLLKAFADHTGLNTTLETVFVLLVPEATPEHKAPFTELFLACPWCVEDITAQAQLPVEVLDAMLANRPVSREQAERVLAVISLRLGYDYGLENVEVVLHSA
jgi:hypothetical protein